MSTNTARQYKPAEVQTPHRVPAQVIPLHPTRWQRGKAWARSTLKPEEIAEVILALTTLVLSGVLLFALYQGLQHYTIL
jgi:predicted HAD superfamily Cof-like phosphohydrolase